MADDFPTDEQAQSWWIVRRGARFSGCAPNAESVTELGIVRSPLFGAVSCGRCGSSEALVLRDGEFRCSDPEACRPRRPRSSRR